ncbi:MAG: hypothetical protein MHMPM18_002542 [Marteilia pararefringens]
MLSILTLLLSSVVFEHFSSADSDELIYSAVELQCAEQKNILQYSSVGKSKDSNVQAIQCLEKNDQSTLRQVSCTPEKPADLDAADYAKLTTEIWKATKNLDGCDAICEAARSYMVGQSMVCPKACAGGEK